MSSPKQPDHEGLQRVQADDGPEVVNRHSQPWNSVEHYPDQNSPQAYTENGDKARAYYYGGSANEGYYGPASGASGHGNGYGDGSTRDEKQQGQSICGLRRKLFFWLLAAIILVVAIAAVLGGVLGTVLGDGSSSSSNSSGSGSSSEDTAGAADSSPALYSNTGVAVHQPDDSSTLYSYYQDPDGRIIENQLENGEWSIQAEDPPDYAIVGTGAQLGSPITAISWNFGENLYRQVFWLDGNGLLLTSNTTGTTAWSAAYNVLIGDTAAPNSIALAACVNQTRLGLNGIRLYYGSSYGMIREVGMDFGPGFMNPEWNQWMIFNGTDNMGGVGCALSDNTGHVYLRNRVGKALQEYHWSYITKDGWFPGPSGPSDLAPGSDITATTDEVETDYIFYESDEHNLIRALSYGDRITAYKNLGQMSPRSKLSSSFKPEGARVFYRDSENTHEISFLEINRNGERQSSGSIG